MIVFWGTGQHYLPAPLQDHPQTKGVLQKRSIAIWAVKLHVASGGNQVDGLPPASIWASENDQQECAPGGLSPTNMLIAKTLYFTIPGTKRIMQECAPGDKGGAAMGFARMRSAIFQ